MGSPPTWTTIGTLLWPLLYAIIAMLVSVLVKIIINSATFKRSSSTRSRELFKLGFFGPDLCLLSLGLILSSQALRALLNGHGIKTNFGENFGIHFGIFLLTVVLFLLSTMTCWLVSDDRYRQFKSKKVEETYQDENGNDQVIDAWEINLKESLVTRGSIVILGFGNLLGVLGVMTYSCFIYMGFVQ